MTSETAGQAVEFWVLAFAAGGDLWCLCQLRFTRETDGTWGDGGSLDDGTHHHGGSGNHAGDSGGHSGDAGTDGGH